MDDFCKENVEDILALTPMQAGLLFHYLSQPESGLYFDQHCYRLKGKVKLDCLKKAWNYVADNNEMLRTVFRWQGLKRPIQIVLKKYSIPFYEYDCSGLNQTEKQAFLEGIRQRDLEEAIHLETKPYRLIVCKLCESEFEMIVSAHHIVYDGWSNALILKELLYAHEEYLHGRTPQRIKKTKYKELVQWYQRQEKQKQKLYWENYLKGYSAKSFLGKGDSIDSSMDRRDTDRSSTVKGMGDSCQYFYRIDPQLEQKINQFIRQEQITLAVLMYTAWGILLHQNSGQEDIVFGVTMSGRMAGIDAVDSMVGLFVNTLPLRIRITEESNRWDILKEVYHTMITFEEYQGTPLVDMKQYSAIGITEQLFDTIVVVQNYPLDVKSKEESPGMDIEFISSRFDTNFDISLDVRIFEGLLLVFNFNGGKLAWSSLEKIGMSFVDIIQTFISEPGIDQKETDCIQNTINHLLELEEVDFDEIL